MANQSQGLEKPRRFTLSLMLVAVVSYAVIPALIGAIGGEKTPFFFLTAWRMGVAVGCLMVLIVLWTNREEYRRGFTATPRDFKGLADGARNRAEQWKGPFSVLARWPILLCILIAGNCDYALFAWSFQYVNIAVTAALFGTWVIISYALSPVLPSERGADSERTTDTQSAADTQQTAGNQWILLLALTGLGLVGYFFIISSEIRTWNDFGNIEVVKKVAAGFGLAIGAMILTQFKELGLNVGKDLKNPQHPKSETVLLFGLLMISSLGASLVSAVVGVAMGEHGDPDWKALRWAFAGGLFVNTFAGFAWRAANMSDETDRTVKVFGVILPVGVLLFLVVFQLVDLRADIQELAKTFSDLRLEYFILGYTTIVAASLLIQFKDDIRWSFEALILALGGCGTFVYFRDDLLDLWLGKDQWAWTGGGYFGSIALVATVFTLLLAFRVARLITRSTDEENRTFSLLRKAERLTREEGGVIDPRVLHCILKIDRTNNQADLEGIYLEIRSYVNRAKDRAGSLHESNRQALSEVESELDMLISSKQTTSILGEIFALLVFAAVTISLALFTIPSESDPWIRLLLDLFAMLVSSVVIFLVIYSVDMDRQRDAHKLAEPTSENGDYLLLFPKTDERLFEQYLAVIGGAAIILVYAVLLADKWGVWDILPGVGL